VSNWTTRGRGGFEEWREEDGIEENKRKETIED
jgi:hypothetical protein